MNDHALAAEPFAEAFWSLVCPMSIRREYRCFRVLQKWQDGKDTDYTIACGGIELYGLAQSSSPLCTG